MSIVDKVDIIKKMISMICELLPVIAGVIKEVITLVKDIKTA